MTHRSFDCETEFEEALVENLREGKGWDERPVLMYPTEEELIANWAEILFESNRGIDRLGDFPLTDGEMAQVLEQVRSLRTPLALNRDFVNASSVTIRRDNPDDVAHLGCDVSLRIYDRLSIGRGKSVYQIARQPRYTHLPKMTGSRRGDLVLLINGMPLIHIELKSSKVPLSNATNQIERYMHEGVFEGIWSLAQIFVAMTPEEAVYFSNPGPDGRFDKDYFFHWADDNNEPINEWEQIAETLLSIPMAHQMIGFYTVADTSVGVLKVLRSYQYYAVSRISMAVSRHDWTSTDQLGGYIWHTTGSGKTLTSFKSAQLIAQTKDADKVVFLVDRIELGTQSYKEYKGFAGDDPEDTKGTVQQTENTNVLVAKLQSTDPAEILIVTSIQKMSRVSEKELGKNSHALAQIRKKRLVFIIDEAHRSTFGDMLITIKATFPRALFFGFTGTPIFEENQKNANCTATIFGNELDRYSIADGIRDRNVLGFNPIRDATFADIDLRRVVAMEKAHAHSEEEALGDRAKARKYLHYMQEVPMLEIEKNIPREQYETGEHRDTVVDDIIANFPMLSRNRKFHAIFATTNIPDAVAYFRLFKHKTHGLNVTALFDPNIDENGGAIYKEDALQEIIADYNTLFATNYTLPTSAQMKKDMAARLSHKWPHNKLERSEQIDLLIVVDQMLTGFDSKWVNTLYMDKVLRLEGIVQAFSRTNRLFGPDKPHGTIKYYRKTHTMQQNIADAFKLYSGDHAPGLFVELLPHNLRQINLLTAEIAQLFTRAGITDFEHLPDDDGERGQFASLFKQLSDHLQAARLQGFRWDKTEYSEKETGEKIEVQLTEETYLILLLRYKELFSGGSGTGGGGNLPYEIDTRLTEIETGKIDAEYMNSRFKKYLKNLRQENVDEATLQQTLDDLHRSFASLTQDEQRLANHFLQDVQTGEAVLSDDKTFRDYLAEYMTRERNTLIHQVATAVGVDEEKLFALANAHPMANNIDEYNRFTQLKQTANRSLAKAYFEAKEGKTLPPFVVNMRIDTFLRKFLLTGETD